MPALEGTVTKLIKKRDGTVFGIETNMGEFLFSWPDKREEPFEDDKVKVGSMVEGTWMPFEKDGKTIRYLSILSVTGEDVTPRGEAGADAAVRHPAAGRRAGNGRGGDCGRGVAGGGRAGHLRGHDEEAPERRRQ